jgi:hypothetical protein
VALQECASYTGRKDLDARRELALMFAFPPYGLYVLVGRLPEQIRAVQTTASQPTDKALDCAPLFLNPLLVFSLPVLAALYQDALNRVWTSAESK